MPDKKPVLLVIEDDPGLQAQLKWAYDDFEVVIAGDRDSALAALRSETPGVVTLDLGLPPEEVHPVPLGGLFHLAGVLVLPLVGGGDRDVRDSVPVRECPDFGVAT